MKLPSVNYLVSRTAKTLRRFPSTMIDAAFGTVTALQAIDPPAYDSGSAQIFQKLIMTFLFGCPLLLSLTLFAERRKWGNTPKLLLQLFGTVLLAAYYFSLPEKFADHSAITFIRFFLLNISLYLMVMVAPYFMKESNQGLWQYNWLLFMRLAATAVCTLALYAGFAFALWALNELFGVHVEGEIYGKLFIIMAGIFAPLFFLAGIPENFEELNAMYDYPNPLKVFAQFILIPLETLYLVILYLYAAKIILTWNLPRGWVSSLILVFSFIGIASQILVYPLRDTEENQWIKKFTKLFYFLLTPLLVMLFLAIGKRVSQYGITESRYFVLLLSFYIAGITFYFVLTQSKNIKIIPVSFCALAFLSSFGPWGAFRVSEQSQIHRLEKLLAKNSILVNGKVVKAKKQISVGDAKEIRSILYYLNEMHGFHDIQRWFTQNLTASCKDKYMPDCVMSMMSISEGLMQRNFSVAAETLHILSVSGYDYLFRLPFSYQRTVQKTKEEKEISYAFRVNKTNYDVVLNKSDSALSVSKNKQTLATFNLDMLVQTLLKKYPEKQGNTNNYYYHGNTPLEDMSVEKIDGNTKIKIYFTSITGTIKNNHADINYFEANLLVKK